MLTQVLIYFLSRLKLWMLRQETTYWISFTWNFPSGLLEANKRVGDKERRKEEEERVRRERYERQMGLGVSRVNTVLDESWPWTSSPRFYCWLAVWPGEVILPLGVGLIFLISKMKAINWKVISSVLYYAKILILVPTHSSLLHTFHMLVTNPWGPYSQGACVLERERQIIDKHGEGQAVTSTTKGNKYGSAVKTDGLVGSGWHTVEGSAIWAGSLMTGGKDSSDYLGMFQVRATAGLKPGAPSKKAKGLDYTLETESLEGQEWGHWRTLDFIPSVRAFIWFQLSEL